MNRPSQTQRFAAWLALLLAMIMLVGGVWLIWWMFHPSTTVVTVTDVAPQPGIGTGNFPRPPRRRGGPPPLLVKDKGVIRYDQREWAAVAKTYRMGIGRGPGQKSDYYRFSVNWRGAFSGDDLKLMGLVFDLTTSPMAEQESKAPKEVIEALRNKLGVRAVAEPIEVDPQTSQACADLWMQFTKADAKDRNEMAGKVLDAVSDACRKSLPANQASLAATVAEARALVPEKDEQVYLANLRAARNARAAAMRAATRPTAPRAATTLPAAVQLETVAPRPATTQPLSAGGAQ